MSDFYDSARYGARKTIVMAKAADAALGSAASAQTVYNRKTMMTNVTIKDWNLEVLTGATCTGTGGVTTEVWTLKIGKSAAGTGTISNIGTITVGTAGVADSSVVDGTVTETNLSAGDDLVWYTDAGTALGDDSLIARANVLYVERYT